MKMKVIILGCVLSCGSAMLARTSSSTPPSKLVEASWFHHHGRRAHKATKHHAHAVTKHKAHRA